MAIGAAAALMAWFLFYPHAAAKTITTDIRGHRMVLDVVDTPDARAQGLSGRPTLAPDQGMLFVFPTSTQSTFWMREMRFPLDIVWIDHGTVVDVVTMSAPAAAGPIPTHTAIAPADRVLEVVAGRASDLGLTTGTRVDVP